VYAQGYCHQLQELHLELNDCRKQFPAQGSLITRTLETRADALSLRAETAVSRGFSQLTTLTDVQDKLSQVESVARDISLWADKANNKLAFESSQWKQELELELEEKKSMLSNICIIANALTSAYPNMDSQALSNLMGDDWTKLHKVQDTLSAKCREKVRSDENGLEVNMETLDDLYNPVMTVLEDIETRLQSREFDVAYDIQQIEWRLNRCQAIQSDMDAHAPDYDMVFEKAEELKLELAESQHPTIDRKLKELDSKWTSVADLLTNR
jgi:chromosome segregation ATPase